MLKKPDKSWSLLHSIFVRNLKLYTSQMSSQVAKWKRKHFTSQESSKVWKQYGNEGIQGQFFNTFEDNFHTYVIQEPCMVCMYGSWTILKTIWNEVHKTKVVSLAVISYHAVLTEWRRSTSCFSSTRELVMNQASKS